MAEDDRDFVWLRGERFNLAYLFDRSTGRILRKEIDDGKGGPGAGFTKRCSGTFVSVFAADSEEVWAQIGDRRFPLDGHTCAAHRRRLRGLVSTLRVSREGEAPISVRDVSLMRPLMATIDPTHDEIDAWAADHLWAVADLINRHENREAFLEARAG